MWECEIRDRLWASVWTLHKAFDIVIYTQSLHIMPIPILPVKGCLDSSLSRHPCSSSNQWQLCNHNPPHSLNAKQGITADPVLLYNQNILAERRGWLVSQWMYEMSECHENVLTWREFNVTVLYAYRRDKCRKMSRTDFQNSNIIVWNFSTFVVHPVETWYLAGK